jgi:hypothetical protein
MSDKLRQSQQRLRESLFELYEQGGLELYLAGTRGVQRDLIIDLETSALTPEKGEIIHFYAVNRWGEGDQCDEWALPSRPLSAEAEQVVGKTNEQLANCRSTDKVMQSLIAFAEI